MHNGSIAGSAQPNGQRKGRVERRHPQLRAKQRLRSSVTSAEAAHARSTSSASTAFIPEGVRPCYTSRLRALNDYSMRLVAAASETFGLIISCWR